MTDSNDKNNSDSLIITEQAPTLNDLLNNNKSIDYMITINAGKMNSPSNIDLTSFDSERNTLPKIHIKINETEPLSMKIPEKKKETSTVIQNPANIKNENQKSIL